MEQDGARQSGQTRQLGMAGGAVSGGARIDPRGGVHGGSRAGAARDTAGKEREAPGQEKLPGGRFLDREESWLRFNQRVLELAEDERVPLLDRVSTAPTEVSGAGSTASAAHPAESTKPSATAARASARARAMMGIPRM